MHVWRGWVAALFLLTAFAGCLGDEAPAQDEDSVVDEPMPAALPDELVEPTLLPPVLLGGGPGEPNVIVAPDGTIYVTAITDLFRSDDGGRTFDRAGDGLRGGGDGDTAVDVTGRVHWLGLFANEGPIPYQYSDDKGMTWTKPLDLSNDTGADREWIAARQDSRTVYAAWRGDDNGDGVISFTSSFDGGETWTELVSVADDAVGGPLAVGPNDGEVYQAQATFESALGAGDASIRLARTKDHGVTWEVVPVLTVPQSVQFGLIGFPFSIFPALDVDQAGNLYLVYAVDSQVLPATVPKPAARFGVYLQMSTDDGDTWSEPRLLSDPAHAAIMPWVAAGAAGRIAVTWYENTLGMPHDNLPDAWNVKLLEAIHMEHEPDMVTVQLNELPVHVGSICTSGTGCLLTGGDRTLLDFFEVALKPDGHPVVTWAASRVPYSQIVLDVDVYARAVESGTPLK